MDLLKSALIAGAIGAIVLAALNHVGDVPDTINDATAIRDGAIVGISVQLVLRISGVS